MVIQVDSREKAHAIQKILQEFDRQGVEWFVSKCFIGDYVSTDNFHVAVDRKQNLSELCNNVVQDHKRFAAELERAKKYGVHLIVLVEHGKSVSCLDDVMDWVNPRLKVSPMAVSGERLFKILSAMQNNRDKYDVEFMFCTKADTGKRIIEILSGGNHGKE